MNIKGLLICLTISFLIVSCGAVSTDGKDFSSTQSNDLIRRNLLLGDDQYQINDPRAFQYGNLHVDGPSGGILYSFSSEPDLLEWLIEHLGLQKIVINSTNELPLDFLAERPRWWDPWKADPSAYYFFSEEFDTGGERRIILVHDSSAGVIYVVDHFEDMAGI